MAYPVHALPHRFKQHDSAGSRCIERVKPCLQGNGNAQIACFFNERPHALSFAADDQRQGPFEIKTVYGCIGPGRCAHNPDILFFQLRKRCSDIGDTAQG